MTDLTNTFWAVTAPKWYHGKEIGRWAHPETISWHRNDAIRAWKSFYPEATREAAWKDARSRGVRAQRVTVTVEERK